MSEIANTGASPTGASAPASAPAQTTSAPAKSTPTAKPAQPNGHTQQSFKAFLNNDTSFSTPTAQPPADNNATSESIAADNETGPGPIESVELPSNDADGSEEDFSWLDNLKPHRQLHGVDIEKLVEALANGELPPELAAVLKTTLKNGEDTQEVSYADLQKNGMFHWDYTRKLQALSDEKRSFHADKDGFLNEVSSWRDPKTLLEAMEHYEFPILDAAKLLAERLDKLHKMHPAERAAYEKEQQLTKREREFERKQRAEQEKVAKASTEHLTKQTHTLIQNTANGLFQKSGLPMEQNTWSLFLRKLTVVSESYAPGTPINEDMVEAAFYATKQVYDTTRAKRASAQEAAKPNQANQFTSPAREQVAARGTVAKVQQPGKNKGGKMTATDFQKFLRK